ncbi:MAG: stoA [Clostridia bacterium]|jgi:thiol-disulfide isomerase/thioredoxin|nr:stoA [Clostridia bacterium]
MIVLNKYKQYSFFLWLIAAVLLFVGANKVYRNYAAKQIIEESFGSKATEKDFPAADQATSDKAEKPKQNAEGKPLVPNFTLENEKGEEVSLSDYSGKVVILNFWASWCPPCKGEMPEFQKINDELEASNDVVLLTINLTDGQRETKEKAMSFLQENKYDFTTLFDTEGIASGIFGIQSIPTTIIIDKEGYLHDYIMGATTKSAVLSSVNEVK